MADKYKYVMVFYDWPEATRMLGHQEKGRMIDAIVKYARGDSDWEELLKGNEKYVFPMFQAQIDRSDAQRDRAAEVHRASGKLGGRPKKNQNGFLENQNNQNGFLETKKTYNKEKEKEENKDNNNHDDDARARDTVEAYAAANLQCMSPGNIQDMTEFMKELPEDVIRFAIDEACGNGAPRWAYVSSILSGYLREGIKTVGDAKEAKAKRQSGKQGKTQLDRNPKGNPAQDYEQREYKAEDYGDDFFIDLDKYGEA